MKSTLKQNYFDKEYKVVFFLYAQVPFWQYPQHDFIFQDRNDVTESQLQSDFFLIFCDVVLCYSPMVVSLKTYFTMGNTTYPGFPRLVWQINLILIYTN